MTKQPTETVAICISTEILDFINDEVGKRKFADVSHAFELMAFEYMKNIEPKDESILAKLERLTLGTVKKSVDVVKDTAATVQDSTMKVYKGSSEKVKDSSIMKGMIDSAGKVQDSTMKAYKFSSEKVKDSVGMVKDKISSKDVDAECKDKNCKGKKIEIDE